MFLNQKKQIYNQILIIIINFNKIKKKIKNLYINTIPNQSSLNFQHIVIYNSLYLDNILILLFYNKFYRSLYKYHYNFINRIIYNIIVYLYIYIVIIYI